MFKSTSQELAQCVSNVLEASDDSIGVHIDYVAPSVRSLRHLMANPKP